MTYGIWNRQRREWFGGFSADGLPAWGPLPQKWPNRLHAESQAVLLAKSDSGVQKSPREV